MFQGKLSLLNIYEINDFFHVQNWCCPKSSWDPGAGLARLILFQWTYSQEEFPVRKQQGGKGAASKALPLGARAQPLRALPGGRHPRCPGQLSTNLWTHPFVHFDCRKGRWFPLVPVWSFSFTSELHSSLPLPLHLCQGKGTEKSSISVSGDDINQQVSHASGTEKPRFVQVAA